MRFHLGLLALLVVVVSSDRLSAAGLDLTLPDEFEVTEYASRDLADNIYAMTVDEKGRVIAAAPGYIRILEDTNGDGTADKATDFANTPKDGAMGLLWEKDHLWVTGDHGLLRYWDRNGDGKADGPPEVICPLPTGTEHGAHAIQRGPGGWLYIISGDSRSKYHPPLSGTSPIKQPVGGYLLRISPDLRTREVIAEGFRNPYDFAISPSGDIFAYDSDNERCIGLPWYEGTRLYHVMPGSNQGWRTKGAKGGNTWRLPPYYLDAAKPVTDLGRGSPTGVTYYNHPGFPAKYRHGLFLLDWTFGRIYFVPLAPSGSTFAGKEEIFCEPSGAEGWAPTDVEVDPTSGDLFVSIGGRGTRGAVYRIHPKTPDTAAIAPPEKSPEIAALHAQRRELEQLYLNAHASHADLMKAIEGAWNSEDRPIFVAAVRLMMRLQTTELRHLVQTAKTPREKEAVALMLAWRNPPEGMRYVDTLLQSTTAPAERLELLRILQLALGDQTDGFSFGTVFEGYSRGRNDGIPSTLIANLTNLFPTGDADLDRELSRTLAMMRVADPKLHAKLLAKITPDSTAEEDTHYLICLGRVGGVRSPEVTQQTAAAVVGLEEKFADRPTSRDRHWPMRVGELLKELARQDPGLASAIVNQQGFGKPGHLLLTQMPGFDRARAAQMFARQAEDDDEFVWTPGLIELMTLLPRDEAQSLLRDQTEDLGVKDAALEALAGYADAEDRPLYEQGLISLQPTTVTACLAALEKLPGHAEPEGLAAALSGLQRLGAAGAAGEPMRQRFARYLERQTGQRGFGTDFQRWSGWFTEQHPDLASRLDGGAVDLKAWKDRWSKIDWKTGDAKRGQEVFQKLACIQCHSGSRAIGPDLRGSGGRYSTDDLMTAIVAPSRDVPERYRTTVVMTEEGQMYQGLVIYDSNQGVLLQTGPDQTIRLTGDQIAMRRVSPSSLMPTGLLDKASDQQIADLIAYLKSLK